MSGPKAPKAYQPAHQPQADAGMFSNLQAANTQTAGTAAIANPGYDANYQGVVSNPYSDSMVQGITAAANNANTIAQGDLAQGAMVGGQAVQGYNDANAVRALAPLAVQDANSIRAQMAPMAGDASAIRSGADTVAGYGNTVAGYAPQFQQLAALSQAYADPLTADATNLRSYAPELMELGLDPNMSEYNFGLQQAKDQQNVANAESGVAGPFAAGATGDAQAAYTRSYNADRATKAMQALSALSGLYGQAGTLDQGALAALAQSGQLTGAAADALNTAGGLQGQAGSMRGQAAGINSNIAQLAALATSTDQGAASLYGQAGDIAGNAANLGVMGSDLAHRGVETQANAAQMPYAAVNQVYADRLSALDDLVAGRTNIASGYQSTAQGYNNYLQTGQQATQLNQNAARINAQNSLLGGLGSLVGELGSAAIEHYSDRRVKQNIFRIGELPSGLPIYGFSYKPGYGAPGLHVGVIAQEARRYFPDAVRADNDDVLIVDYSKVA